MWNGAVVLGAAMEKWSREGTLPLAARRILELGAGSGLLAAVLASQVGDDGSLVVATEQADSRGR